MLPKSPIPVAPIPDLAGNRGRESRFGRNRETGNPRFRVPIRPRKGIGPGSRRPRAGDSGVCNSGDRDARHSGWHGSIAWVHDRLSIGPRQRNLFWGRSTAAAQAGMMIGEIGRALAASLSGGWYPGWCLLLPCHCHWQWARHWARHLQARATVTLKAAGTVKVHSVADSDSEPASDAATSADSDCRVPGPRLAENRQACGMSLIATANQRA